MTPSLGVRAWRYAQTRTQRALELIRAAWRNNTAHGNLFYHTDGLFDHADGAERLRAALASSSGASARIVFDFIWSAM
jgi:hypothetical protein